MTEKIFEIDKGGFKPVAFGSFTGRAAVNEAGTEVAFPGSVREFRKVKAGTVDAAAVEVLSVAAGNVSGMVVLTVEPMAAANPPNLAE